jgi:transglutaminase-like putative cysteine protease
MGEIKRIHAYVRDNIRYLRDIHGVETLQSPPETLRRGYGDCDDKATLAATLLAAIGHPSRFVAIGRAPGKFSHVYVETRIGPRWISLETTEPVDVGWSPSGVLARMVAHN